MTQDLPQPGAVKAYPEPDAADVRELLLDWCGADADDADDAVKALGALDDDARETADRLYQSIAADMGGKKWLSWPKVTEPHSLLGLYPLLAAVPDMLAYHRERGIDEDLSRKVLVDVGEKLRLEPADLRQGRARRRELVHRARARGALPARAAPVLRRGT